MQTCTPYDAKILNNLRCAKSAKLLHIRHVIIATDKFKGGLGSVEAADAIKKGLQSAFLWHNVPFFIPDRDYNIVAIADGGDGSADIFKVSTGAEQIFCTAVGPLGRRVKTSFMFCRAKRVAFIEMAQVSGLAMIKPADRNPMHTTTYGMGELILKAAEAGAKKIIVGIGGSATNDCGAGLLQALGYKYLNSAGKNILDKRDGAEAFITGGNLSGIKKIIPPSCNSGKAKLLRGVEITVVCDVKNPLTGSNGATYAYGPQKGAGKKELVALENGVKNFLVATEKSSDGCDKKNREATTLFVKKMAKEEGAGAAGGVGFALMCFLKAKKMSGFDYFAKLQRLESKIRQADIVISGEGMIDAQSLKGKVIGGVIGLAKKTERDKSNLKFKKKVWLFCGASKIKSGKDAKIFPMSDIEPDMKKRMNNEATYLKERACAATLEELLNVDQP
ncbi:MAG: glycerate kinase [Bacteroidales bacterium]|jgi:glycerate kinase|nr:glycerate kinase [Bacteroidales bacterium]